MVEEALANILRSDFLARITFCGAVSDCRNGRGGRLLEREAS